MASSRHRHRRGNKNWPMLGLGAGGVVAAAVAFTVGISQAGGSPACAAALPAAAPAQQAGTAPGPSATTPPGTTAPSSSVRPPGYPRHAMASATPGPVPAGPPPAGHRGDGRPGPASRVQVFPPRVTSTC